MKKSISNFVEEEKVTILNSNQNQQIVGGIIIEDIVISGIIIEDIIISGIIIDDDLGV